MPLIEPNPAIHILDGLVKCRNCGTQMETAGESFNEAPRYVCVTRNEGCDTQDTLAEPFNRLMVSRVINAILDNRNTQIVVDAVRKEAIVKGHEDAYAISDLHSRMPSLGNLVGKNPPVPSENPEPSSETARYGRRIEAEYIERLERSGPYTNIVQNPREVAKYSARLDTYLRPSNARTTRTIMEMAVREILVDPALQPSTTGCRCRRTDGPKLEPLRKCLPGNRRFPMLPEAPSR